MHKHLAAVASAIAFACAPMCTQAATPASADPAVVEATKQMMAAMKLRDVMRASMRQLDKQIPMQLKASLSAAIAANPKLNEQQKAEAEKKLEQALPVLVAQTRAVIDDPSLIDDMMAEMVPLYAETYTLDEIHQLSAFYASPVGQKMLTNMPTLMARSMEISNRVMLPRIQKMMQQTAQQLTGK